MIKRIPATEEPCPYRKGEVRRLDGRQVRIESIQRESLGAVTQRQLVDEGWKSRSAWRADWVRRWDKHWRPLYVPVPSEIDLCRRFGQQWADKDHWVIRYSILDAERFLANQRGKANGDGQYTASVSRAIDTLPVIDPDPAYVRHARERDAKVRAERAESFRQDLSVARAQRNAERSRLRMQRFSG